MTRPDPSGSIAAAPRRPALHPLVAAAAIGVIALCAVAIAAILGWLPVSGAGQAEVAANTAPGGEQAQAAPPQTASSAPAGAAAASAASAAQARAQAVAQNGAVRPGNVAPAPAQAAACPQCGVVTSINRVQVPAQDNSNHLVGTVAGGVVGGVVGNQFGGGSGKTALTVLGAVGGALAGREIERNISEKTVTRYQLVARTNDGQIHTFRSDSPFPYSVGQAIRVDNNQLLPR